MLNNIIWVVFDSARYDSFVEAHTPMINRIGSVERRYSYASWTAPSHYAFLMGLPPHANKPGQLTSDAQRDELALWRKRIGGAAAGDITFGDFAPALSLPRFLKQLGYRTQAYVSMPVLNPQTLIAHHFDEFEMMPAHNDFRAILRKLTFDDTPRFIFINTGETHYPYTLPDESATDMPYIPGLHGVWRDLDDFLRNPAASRRTQDAAGFDEEKLRPLWRKQVHCIENLDIAIGELIDLAPPESWFIVTSDHGELFGEGGYFGHGPIAHEKVFEVFFAEGQSPRRRRAPMTDSELHATVLGRLKQLGYL